MRRPLARLLLLAGVLSALAGAALTAANAVPTTRLDAYGAVVNANAPKPAACAALSLRQVQLGGGGSGGSALILGTAGNDNLDGGRGSDRIVGGARQRRPPGQQRHRRLHRGPGVDSFHRSCEVTIQ